MVKISPYKPVMILKLRLLNSANKTMSGNANLLETTQNFYTNELLKNLSCHDLLQNDVVKLKPITGIKNFNCACGINILD